MEFVSPEKQDMEHVSRDAAGFVLELYNQYSDTKLPFHNFQLAHNMANQVQEIADADALDPDVTRIATLAAWFLPVGYAVDYHHPLEQAIREFQHFARDVSLSSDYSARVLVCLKTILSRQVPASPEERLLSDAYAIAGLIRNGVDRLDLQKLEWELMEGHKPEKKAWLDVQWTHLLNQQLYTRHAKITYQESLALLLLELKKMLKKESEKNEPDTPVALFDFLEPESPIRAAQTFFRVSYRTHISLSAIADKKAHIMISVNSIVISILITFLSYRNLTEVKPHILLPVIIFLVTGLTSLIFAVLSARPKVTALNRNKVSPAEVRKNVAFFGNFVTLELHEYEAAMDSLFRSTELLYGNMARDIYYLGKVLDKKYRYLTVSYNLFMVGFAATVIMFLIVLLS